jgi:pimeloyl-ACP methyl ester carboxylesterase
MYSCRVQEALRLPPSHFFGVCIGAYISLQIAISYPDKVLSLFMVSPLPMREVGYFSFYLILRNVTNVLSQQPREVEEGLQEIYDCWVEAFKDPAKINTSALSDAFYGVMQFGFNGSESSLTNA